MTQVPLSSDPDAPGTQLSDAPSPAGSAGLNSDSVSVNGREAGQAHDESGEAGNITAHLLQEASAALKARDEH